MLQAHNAGILGFLEVDSAFPQFQFFWWSYSGYSSSTFSLESSDWLAIFKRYLSTTEWKFCQTVVQAELLVTRISGLDEGCVALGSNGWYIANVSWVDFTKSEASVICVLDKQISRCTVLLLIGRPLYLGLRACFSQPQSPWMCQCQCRNKV